MVKYPAESELGKNVRFSSGIRDTHALYRLNGDPDRVYKYEIHGVEQKSSIGSIIYREGNELYTYSDKAMTKKIDLSNKTDQERAEAMKKSWNYGFGPSVMIEGAATSPDKRFYVFAHAHDKQENWIRYPLTSKFVMHRLINGSEDGKPIKNEKLMLQQGDSSVNPFESLSEIGNFGYESFNKKIGKLGTTVHKFGTMLVENIADTFTGGLFSTVLGLTGIDSKFQREMNRQDEMQKLKGLSDFNENYFTSKGSIQRDMDDGRFSLEKGSPGAENGGLLEDPRVSRDLKMYQDAGDKLVKLQKNADLDKLISDTKKDTDYVSQLESLRKIKDPVLKETFVKKTNDQIARIQGLKQNRVRGDTTDYDRILLFANQIVKGSKNFKEIQKNYNNLDIINAESMKKRDTMLDSQIAIDESVETIKKANQMGPLKNRLQD